MVGSRGARAARGGRTASGLEPRQPVAKAQTSARRPLYSSTRWRSRSRVRRTTSAMNASQVTSRCRATPGRWRGSSAPRSPSSSRSLPPTPGAAPRGRRPTASTPARWRSGSPRANLLGSGSRTRRPGPCVVGLGAERSSSSEDEGEERDPRRARASARPEAQGERSLRPQGPAVAGGGRAAALRARDRRRLPAPARLLRARDRGDRARHR
jgi:hypothetical protein